MLIKYKKSLLFLVLSLCSCYAFYQYIYLDWQVNKDKLGKVIDQFYGVNVYYNGSIANVSSRATYSFSFNKRLWKIDSSRVLVYLRKI